MWCKAFFISGKCLLLFAMLISFSGCTTTAVQYNDTLPPAINTKIFGKRPNDIPSVEDILGINEHHAAKFLDYYKDYDNKNVDPHRRVSNYVMQLLEEFEYNRQTLITNVALDNLAGDCMTLATLTTALAELVNIRTDYRFINNSPFYDQRGNVVLRSNHIRTVLYDPNHEVPLDSFFSFTPYIKIDFYPSPGDVPGKRVNKRQFLAMFYRNLAAVELTRENYERSFWLMMEAMNLAPYDHENINMMAVLHRRSGHNELAEKLYLYGLENTISKVSLLKNYRILLNKEGRFEEANEISQQLANLDDPNPFNWIFIAEDYFAKQDYSNAIYYFNKAVDTAPYLHHAYLGLSKTYLKQGKYEKAQRAMNRALEKSPEGVIRERYQTKLDAILKVSLNQTN